MGESSYWVRLEREVVSVSGPEAGAYLQGQLSQDLDPLEPGSSAWSWLLAPNGKVDALVRVSRQGDGAWLLDTDAGWGDAVFGRLQRFKLRTKVDLERPSASVIAVRGLGWEDVVAGAGGPAVVSVPPWPGLAGADLIYLGAAGAALPAGSEMTAAAYEVVRIRAAQPRMGFEIGEKTMPGETGLVPWTVSFTKGCYTGQELVARVDSRGGNVPRRLCRLRSPAAVDGGSGAGGELFSGDTVAGTVTSVADLALAGSGPGWVGLGYLKRGFEPPLTLTCGRDGPEVEVQRLPW